ncbi:MAG TPA: DNA-processing protein DprA [Candidatus Limnocylindria bacterium]|nr:DNA-processing protein DprA [Candidatus Limnocylindria bacterium]
MIGVGTGARSADSTGRLTEREAWVALSLVPGIGQAGFARLVRGHGSASAVWRAGPGALSGLRLPDEVRGRAVELLSAGDPRSLARGIASLTATSGGRVVTELDEEYPPALLTLEPRPPVLYVAGDGAALRERAVAVVGTRAASGYGLSTATELGQELGSVGVPVVSGLALGIDGAAHRGALAAGGRTVAILPSPLDRVYPPRHRQLAREIVAGGGALVTELPSGASVGRPDFARRNRIIAGLAQAVVVVEAPDRSGALLTAAAALSVGRELYAVPGPIDARASRGCNRLIADHEALMVTSIGALMGQVGVAIGARPPAIAALSEVEGQLLRHLLERSGSIEELVDRTGQSAAAVASGLTLLEARGLVNPFGGATFHPTLAAKRLAKVV